MAENNNASSGSETGLFATLSAARKAVPAVDFALGVAGIAAAAALISIFLGKGTAGYIVLGITFLSMVLLLVFAGLVRSGSRATSNAGTLLLWSVVIFFVAFLMLTLSAVVLSWPQNWATILGLVEKNAADKLTTRERDAIREITTWLCKNVGPSPNLQTATQSLRIDTFEKVVRSTNEKDSHWFVQEIKGNAFQIQYRYAIDGEDDIRYGQRISILELTSSRIGALRGVANREAFLQQFGEPQDYGLGRRVGSEAKLDDANSSSLVYVNSWGAMPVIEVEWWDDASLVHFRDMCVGVALI